MNNLIRETLMPVYLESEIKNANKILEKHGQINVCNNNAIFEKSYGAKYSGNYFRKSIKRSFLKNCEFINADFTRVAATGSKFIESSFIDCKIISANFQYCDFSGSKFITKKEKCIIESSNLSESNFSNTLISNVEIISSSFSRVLFENSIIQNCVIKSATFENAIFNKAILRNLELRNLNLEYADFNNIELQNVVLPFYQIPYTFGGLSYILSSKNQIWISSKINNEKRITIEEYKEQLELLKIYYTSIGEYFPLANIYIAFRQYDIAYNAIVSGILNSIFLKDFRMLKFYCKLASRTNQFSNIQLNNLFNKIHEVLPINKLSNIELHNYEIHIGEIRSILLNKNESNKLITSVYIKTKIKKENEKELLELFVIINNSFKFFDPLYSYDFIEIRHNSPYELLVQFTQNDFTITISILTTIFYFLRKANKGCQEFIDTILKMKEITEKNILISKLKEEAKKQKKINELYSIEYHINGTNSYNISRKERSLIHYEFKESSK